MNDTADATLKKWKRVLLLTYLGVWLSIVVVCITFVYINRNSQAETFAKSLRNSLLVRDLRTVNAHAATLVPSVFCSIQIASEFRPDVINVNWVYPSTNKAPWCLGHVKSMVFSDSENQHVAFEVKFSFPLGLTLFMTFVMGCLPILTLFPILKKLEAHSLKEQERKLKEEQSVAMALMASQLSHDIRSPLSALNMIINQLNNLPETQRLLLRNSANRINDLANTLLTKGKNQQTHQDANSRSAGLACDAHLKMQIELMPALVDAIVSEKRVQFRDKIGIDIDVDLQASYGAFAKVSATEFSRVVSNLLNNAIEGLPDSKGKIFVSVEIQKTSVEIAVRDNGKGIPAHILEKLGQLGVTHGKQGTQSGSGLGVYHAKKTIESFGGKFEIVSNESPDKHGTIIRIGLPLAPAPKWFVDKLVLAPRTTVISLDDDLSVHGIYKNRFHDLNIDELQIVHRTFTSGQEFKTWYHKQTTALGHEWLFLVDFELLNQSQNGLEIINELGLGSRSILVTSRYDESSIKYQCDKLGIRLIPKQMVSIVPIQLAKPKKQNFTILIDDDITLIHSIWQMAAKEKQKPFAAFAHPADFFKVAAEFDLSTPLYIDSNLGSGIKGEIVAKEIFALGFHELYLCTGYDPSEFSEMPWIKKIVSKDPAF